MATLTTSPQIVGRNEAGTIKTYLYAWYDGQSGNSCTVHTRLTCKCVGTTYTGSNKTYFMRLGGYDSQILSWKYAPLYDGQEYTVAEASWTYSGGSQIYASAGFWSYVFGSADIGLSGATYVPTFNSSPTGLSVSIAEVYPTGAKFNVSLSSYGNPSGVSGRWIEAGIAGQNAWQSPSLRSAIATNTRSAQITVDNNSTKTTTLTIRPNTQYYYGGYAWNTALDTSVMSGKLVTKAEAPTVLFVSSTATSATFSYSVSADGGHYAKTIQYSLDGGTTWREAATISGGSAKTGSFTVNGLLSGAVYTMQIRMSTTAGITSGDNVSFDTLVDEGDNKNIFYGSVGRRAKEIRIVYGSVNNETQPITRLYGAAYDIDSFRGAIRRLSRYSSIQGFDAAQFKTKIMASPIWSQRTSFGHLRLIGVPGVVQQGQRLYRLEMYYKNGGQTEIGYGVPSVIDDYGIIFVNPIPSPVYETIDDVVLSPGIATKLIHQGFGHNNYS